VGFDHQLLFLRRLYIDMAGYRTHLATSSVLGALYGSAGIVLWDLDWGVVFLGAGLTALGGLLPDLDSDSGVPIRELFGLSAAAAPFLLYTRLTNTIANNEQTLVILAAVYLFIRYGVSSLVKRVTVHRGIFHSIPAMLVAGLAVYLLYKSANPNYRVFLAVGAMLGFLSHLILDEIYSVDFMGLQIKLNKYAGSALKFYSSSWKANGVCFLILLTLAFLCLVDTPLE
jgi:membrane-bound metal-dependent hydrolase YbcI (DUF457 family)